MWHLTSHALVTLPLFKGLEASVQVGLAPARSLGERVLSAVRLDWLGHQCSLQQHYVLLCFVLSQSLRSNGSKACASVIAMPCALQILWGQHLHCMLKTLTTTAKSIHHIFQC